MANQSGQKRGPGRPPKNSNTNKSSGQKRGRPAGSTNKPKQAPQPKDYTFRDFYHDFSKRPIFYPLAVIVVTTVLVLLDLLFSWNNFERFFTFVGIEIVIAAIISMFKVLASQISTEED